MLTAVHKITRFASPMPPVNGLTNLVSFLCFVCNKSLIHSIPIVCQIIKTCHQNTFPPSIQAVELKATKLHHVGPCDAATYAIAKKKTSFEFLREKMHLRPRTNTIGAVARIRNALAYATHKFFQENGFLYVHTPVITASDCEGAGEMFQVCKGYSKQT
jgi:aspartyl/asparaginyl-tRNA synthetase